MSQRTGQKRVMFVANAAWNLANFRRPVIESFVSDGHEVLAMARPDGHEHKLSAMGARFIPMSLKAAKLTPLNDALLIARLARVFASERPDMIFSFTVKPNIYSALAARMAGTPIVPTISGLGSSFLAGGALSKLVEGLYGIAFRKARAVMFQNSSDRDLFVEHGLVEPDQARLVAGSGVDIRHFGKEPLPQNSPPKLLYVGRMLRDKGLVELAEVIRLVKGRGVQLDVELLGDTASDNPSAIPEETLARWQDEGLVTHHAPVDDVRPFIAGADGLVLPSYREGLPRSLLEGAAMGRPLIASDVPGCRDVIDDGANGLLFAPRSASALADSIEQFCQMSAEERDRMGEAARAKVETEFSVVRVIAAYATELSR